MYYASEGDVVLVNREASFSKEVLAEFTAPEVQTHRQDAILAIKKPDYLGDSQWDFRSGQTPVRAPIGDSDWLTSFRQRRFEIKPGDSLRVLLETQVGQDADGNVLEPRYRVLKVYGVVHGDAPGQPEFEMGDDVGRG